MHFTTTSLEKNNFKHRCWFYGELSAKKQISIKIYITKEQKNFLWVRKGTPKSHFYNFCYTAYSGRAIHKHQLAPPVHAVTPTVVAREYFHQLTTTTVPVGPLSTHKHIKNKQVPQEVSNHCEFSNCLSLLCSFFF